MGERILCGIVGGLSGGMTSSKDYRRYAAECLDLVERLANPDDKARLIEMAQNFLKMAEQQDVREKGDARRYGC